MARLGIIAGGGALPRRLADACKRDGRDHFIIGFHGQTDLVTSPHAWTKLGATNEAIDILKKNGVTQLVMAGNIRRPTLAEMKPDLRTLQVFARLGAKAFGDDALLRGVTQELEKEGFQVLGAHEIDPSLITAAGTVGKIEPQSQHSADIARGIAAAKDLGRLDIGQGVVVQQGIVLAVEAVEGTDAMLERCRKLRRKGTGGVLVKCCKPQQDTRIDLPTVGLRTVRKAYEAGLAGIAVEAGASIMLDRDDVAAAADQLGLFVIGYTS